MMLWLWFGIGLVACIGGLVLAVALYDDVGDMFLLPGGLALVGLIVAFVFGAMLASQHYARVSCRTFSQTTNRPTRFVHYTAYSWDCLTRTANGRWIPTKNLREFGETP